MGSGASASARDATDGAEQLAAAPLQPLEQWDVEFLAKQLDGDAEYGAAAAYVRTHGVNGAAALKLDETKIAEVVGQNESGMRRLLELRQTLAKNRTMRDADDDGASAIAAAAAATAEGLVHDEEPEESKHEGSPRDGSCDERGLEADDDGKRGAADEKDGEDETLRGVSLKVVRSQGSLFFEGANRGVASAVNTSELEAGGSGGFEYEDGFNVVCNDKPFGVIRKRLGMGGMGTVYLFTPADEADKSDAALKTIRTDVSLKKMRELEKSLTTAVAICFAAGRSHQIASVRKVLVPQTGQATNARGLMLVCDLVDEGDLEEAMHSGAKKRNGQLQQDYLGKLYSEKGGHTWPLGSILLQIFMAFDHIHARGIIHQDFKPANLMLCSSSLVKLTDFGLASFSRKVDKDPWTEEEVRGGQLCANFVGGTPEYFSPQQHSLFMEGPKLKDEELRAFEEAHLLTPATSDLYQGALTVFEMHARYLPDDARIHPEAADRCAMRTPTVDFEKLSPEQLEGWLAEKKIEPPLEGVLVAKGIGGTRMLELVRASTHKELKEEFALKLAAAKKMQMFIGRHLSSPADAMTHEKVGTTLRKCLDAAVGERYSTAQQVLCDGLGAKCGRDYKRDGIYIVRDITTAAGADLLSDVALKKLPDHDATIIDETLGGLTKRLFEHNEMEGALASCSEWMGVAPSSDSRAQAVSAYNKLLKVCGGQLRLLDLSRRTHGHWNEMVLSGEDVVHGLATSLSVSGAAATLEEIDLSEQPELEGNVLEVLIEVLVLPKLRTLKLTRCKKATGVIPKAIGQCTSLTKLDLRGCEFSGELPKELGDLINLTELDVSSNSIEGELPKELGDLVNLTILYLDDNAFRGSIPVEFGQLVNLEQLFLQWNRMTGELPKELGNLVNLTGLWLQENGFQGELPKELGNLVNLKVLTLDNNEFQGKLYVPSYIHTLGGYKGVVCVFAQ